MYIFPFQLKFKIYAMKFCFCFSRRIPDWAEEACKPGGPMEEIAKVVYLLRAKPKLVRIRSGFLLKEMLERFETKEKGKLKPDRVLWMYSAHSSTITTLLNGLRFNMVSLKKLFSMKNFRCFFPLLNNFI